MSDLKKQAAAYFEAYPNEDKFFATSDGQFFTEKNKSSAFTHASRLAKGKKGSTPTEFNRSEMTASKGGASTGADEVILPEGEPTKAWTNAQLQKYLIDNKIDFETDANKKALLETIEKAKADKADTATGNGDDGDDQNPPAPPAK